MILDNCDFTGDGIKGDESKVQTVESSFDLETVNYDLSIDHAITDLQNIIDSLQQLKRTKNICGYVRYNVTTKTSIRFDKSVKKSIKGKVMI